MVTFETFKGWSKKRIVNSVEQETLRRMTNNRQNGMSHDEARDTVLLQARKAQTAEDALRFLNGEEL